MEPTTPDDWSRSETVPIETGSGIIQRRENVYCIGKVICVYSASVSPTLKKVFACNTCLPQFCNRIKGIKMIAFI